MKTKTMLMQNFGGQTKSIMVFSEVAYCLGHLLKKNYSSKGFKLNKGCLKSAVIQWVCHKSGKIVHILFVISV